MVQATHRQITTPRKPIASWMWLLIGLSVGLSISFFPYLQNHSKETDLLPATQPQVPVSATKKQEPGIKNPKFDFYRILPEMEVVIPQAKEGVSTPLDQPGTYILQVGSFRSLKEADDLKAKLIPMGIEAKIETVTVNSIDTWHRVRIGPYQDLKELNKIRSKLLENNVNAILLRLSG